MPRNILKTLPSKVQALIKLVKNTKNKSSAMAVEAGAVVVKKPN